MTELRKQCTICGAGLVGSLLSIYLIQRGFQVRVIEKRNDPRRSSVNEGRSINLAISHRGIHALQKALPGLEKKVLALSVPMRGRRIHDIEGNLTFQPYGTSDEHIHSIGRADLNRLLIHQAEALGVSFHFGYECERYDTATEQWSFRSKENVFLYAGKQEWLIGADGAFSVIRDQLKRNGCVSYSVEKLDYAYKEIDIQAAYANTLTDREALHIWPRERFMLIALPNTNGSYTATLFLPLQGEISFASLTSDSQIQTFFSQYFKDAEQLIPDLAEQFHSHPTSGLSLVHTATWSSDNVLLAGDAAHAIVPFYGQGMNAGFEDCRILAEIIDAAGTFDMEQIGMRFYDARKKNTDAISDLALQNFIEMRDLVADKEFLVRKKVEAFLHQSLPHQYIPQYTMVSFTDIPYAEAKEKGAEHQRLLDIIMQLPGIVEGWPGSIYQEQALALAQQYL